MKLAVFDDFRIGVVSGDRLHDVTGALPDWLGEIRSQRMNWLIANWATVRDRIVALGTTSDTIAVASVKLMPPSPTPPHVFAAPANYRKHIGELGDRVVTKKGRSAREQGFFLKAPGSLVGAGGVIGLPRDSTRRFDHESELAVIIGRHGRNIPRAEAMQYVFG